MAKRVLALVAARNEADILDDSIRALTEQGVSVYVIDDGSTDGTADIARAWMDRGVVGVEQRESADEAFDWTSLLRRKEQLADSLDADWFIHHDADEFRESPWPGITLVDAITTVDGAGYNAIDFGLLEFWPTDVAGNGNDVRERIPGYLPGPPFNRTQVRCWKRGPSRVDLSSSGGHDVTFDNRRVFPLRFLLRHYPVRSAEHGRRKIFTDRLPRFSPEERRQGWHIQYDGLAPDSRLTRRPSELTMFGPSLPRMAIALEDVAAFEETLAQGRAELATAQGDGARLEQDRTALAGQVRDVLEERERLTSELARVEQSRRQLEASLTATQDALAGERDARLETHAQLTATLAESKQNTQDAAEAYARLAERCAQGERAHAALELERDRIWRDLQTMYASKTWRWTRLLRRAFELFDGSGRRQP